MAASPLIIGATQRQELAALRAKASAEPFDVLAILEQTKSKAGHEAHLERMKAFTIPIPTAFIVTFSIENGHPPGTCRHLSVSSRRHGRTPTPEAVWMIAEELGFIGGLQQCAFWEEEIGEGDKAINVVQPVAVTAGSDRFRSDEDAVRPHFEIEWRDAGKEPKVAPNPDYPKGIDLDCSNGAAVVCQTPLPYPARRIGSYIVECRICGIRVGCTTAGRPDDPRSLKVACKPLAAA
jgi:hypothetical protein